MASTYSNLKIQLMGTGENSGTWGNVTNVNLGTAIEEAIVGSADVTFSSADVTLNLTDTNESQTARNLRLNLVGVSGGNRQLIVPAIEKLYIVNNQLANQVTIKVTGQTGVVVPAGKTMFVYNDGLDVVDAITHLSSLTTGSVSTTTPIAAASGGTGLNAPGTAGNVLVSTGTGWVSGVAFVTGMIMMWSGSVGTIPSGWALCDGSNGTPNLTDRFVIGAGSAYAVNATGGSKDAIVVAHTHTATSTVVDPGHTHSIRNDNNNQNGFTPNGGDGQNPSTTTVGTSTTGITVNTTVASAGSSGVNANLPPYYALAFIMKL